MKLTAVARMLESEKEQSNSAPFLRSSSIPIDESHSAAPASNSVPLDAVHVDRLLAQLQSRSMALVPYAPPRLEPTMSSRILVPAALITFFLTIVLSAALFVRLKTPSGQVIDQAPVAGSRIIYSTAGSQGQKVGGSINEVDEASSISSSKRLDQLEAALERSNRDLQAIAAKVTTTRAVRPSAARVKTVPKGTLPVLAEPPSAANEPTRVIDIKPTETAVAHHGGSGAIDYWVVPSGPENNSSPSSVLPISKVANGLLVENLTDGKSYVLTSSGKWLSVSILAFGK